MLLYYDAKTIGLPFAKRSVVVPKLFMMSYLTYNCMAMHDDIDDYRCDGVARSNRPCNRNHIAHEFVLLACNFFALQECRSIEGTFRIPHFFCIASGHKQGSLGVEFWVRYDAPLRVYDSVNDVCEYIDLDPSWFIAVHKTPRVLIVTAEILDVPFAPVVVHAPGQSHGTKTVRAFWVELFKVFADLKPVLNSIIIFGDFNLHFGSITSVAIGDFFPQKQSTPANELHKWTLENLFCIPFTFSSYHDSSDPATYIHHDGRYTEMIAFVCHLML